MTSSWRIEVAAMPNSLQWSRLSKQDFPRNHESHEGWEIYEDLAEKTLQWELTPEESRIAIPVSSKRGLHSIET